VLFVSLMIRKGPLLLVATTSKRTSRPVDASALAAGSPRFVDHVVASEWDAAHDRVVTSPSLSRVYGVLAIDGVSRGFSLVHPDDYEHHQAGVHAAVDRGRGYRSSFRIIRPDTHAVVWIDERAEAIPRAAPEPAELIGLAFDATVRHDGRPSRAKLAVLDALEEFGDRVLTIHASYMRRLSPHQRTVRGAWIATAIRAFEQLQNELPNPSRHSASAIRAAAAAWRERYSKE
jgi:hypothetical protein